MKLDGCSLRPLGLEDFELVRPVLHAVPPALFQVPQVEAGYRHFLGRLSKLPWSLPCACFADARLIGLCFMQVGQLRNLSAYLVAAFAEADEAGVALALYVRHAFWTYPLNKLYTHVPDHPASRPYAATLTNSGFQQEGKLVAHVTAGDQAHDALLFGLLRKDFETWSARHEPRLLLS